MESLERGKALLIASIEADAQNEEKQIIAEAEKKAEEKRKYAKKKVESLLSDARQEADEQAEIVKKRIISGADFEIKRNSLRLRGVLMREIMDHVEKKLALMTDEPEYKSVLVDWITEAAAGLETESAIVNVSEKERALFDDTLLSEAARKIQEQTGRKIALELSNAESLQSQGVVLTAADGRTAFNNQVATRILRSQREIQTLIYNELFADERKE